MECSFAVEVVGELSWLIAGARFMISRNTASMKKTNAIPMGHVQCLVWCSTV